MGYGAVAINELRRSNFIHNICFFGKFYGDVKVKSAHPADFGGIGLLFLITGTCSFLSQLNFYVCIRHKTTKG